MQNTINRYFKTRAQYEYLAEQGGNAFLIKLFKETLDKRRAALSDLTQEELDSAWTGRLKADLIDEFLADAIVSSIDRCFACKNWDDSEETNGCLVYDELLVVCDRWESKIEV